MKKINLGLIGFGTVGSGVFNILRDKKSFLSEKVGMELNIKRICEKDIIVKKSLSTGRDIFTTDPKAILEDPDIDIVIELIGGIHPAKEFIIQAIKKGKNVVTANKALLAEHGQELFTLARDYGKSIYFEAAVGAGIPIIKSLRESLVANRFSGIYGILNGTSNYILSKMSNEGYSFSDALTQAKKNGFAEKDSSLDINGIDSAHKLALLVYLCFGKLVDLNNVFVEGISGISLADTIYAREMGFTIKLLAIVKREGQDLEVRVHPTLIPQEHLLSSVSGVFNAIYVLSDLAGELLFYGPGAGQKSAASAVVADIVDLTQDIRAGLFKSSLASLEDKSIKKIRDIDDCESRYYIRFMALDKPGVLAKVSGILAKFGISIASVTQKERCRAKTVPIVMILHEAREKDLRVALEVIRKSGVIKEELVAVRIEDVYGN